MSPQYIYGIAVPVNDSKPEQHLLDAAKTEHELTDEQLEGLKQGNLFKLADYFMYRIYDTDVVLYDEDAETYYSTSDSHPTTVDRDDVVALVDENGEMLTV